MNPRPPVLCRQLYMLSAIFDLATGYPTGRENQLRFRIGFSESTPDMLHRELVRIDACVPRKGPGRTSTAPVRRHPTGV